MEEHKNKLHPEDTKQILSDEEEPEKKIVKENILKITGGFSLQNPLKNGHTYHIEMILDIYAHEEKDEQDGGVTNVYKSRSRFPAIVTNDEGRKLKTKNKSTEGQKTRFAIEGMYDSSDDALKERWSKEGFYAWYQGQIRHHNEALLKFFLKEAGEKI